MDMYTEEHPNITFEKTEYEYPKLQTIVPSLLATGAEDVDFIWWYAGPGTDQQWAKDGLLKNMDELYEIYNWEDRQLGAIQSNYTQGHGWYFFADGGIAAPVLYWNQKILDEAGVEVPTTIEGFFDIADDIKAAGYDVIMPGYRDLRYLMNIFMMRYMGPEEYSALPNWIRDDNRTAETAEIFKSEGVVKSFELLKRFNDAGMMPEGLLGMDYGGRERHFVSDNCAFYTNGDWAVTYVTATAEDMGVEFELGAGAFPALTEGGDQTFLAGLANGIIVPAGISDEKFTIIGDLLNSTIQKEWAKETFQTEGIMAVNTGWETEEIAELVKPAYLNFYNDFVEHGSGALLGVNLTQKAQDAWLAAGDRVLLGELTPEEAAQALYDAVVSDLD